MPPVAQPSACVPFVAPTGSGSHHADRGRESEESLFVFRREPLPKSRLYT